MPFITDVPEAVTDAGQDFNYPDPPTFATIVLVNAPMDPDHNNVGLNQAAYDAFIEAEIAATEDPTVFGGRAWILTDQLVYDPEYSFGAEVAYEDALRFYNYGRVTIGERTWYVFYTPLYVNPNATRFVADIDEFPSFEWTLGYSVIERGHIAVAASQDDTYGANYLTAPEPIDAPPVRGVVDAALLGASPEAWTVLVVSVNDLRGQAGDNYKFWNLHQQNDAINTAATLATAATIDSSHTPQAVIPQGNYPWEVVGVPTGGDGVTPENGFVPDDLLTVLDTATGTNPAQAELNTAAAWASVVANYPSAHISATVSGAPASPAGYWSRDLDTAIHADPSLYGITDPDLAPIGHSPHGLGIRINVGGVTPAEMSSFGFSEFNSYTYTFQGPYSWDTGPTTDNDVYVPYVTDSPVSTIDGVEAGGGVYLFTMEGFAEYMNTMQGAPWVTAGIVDIRLVPSWAVSGGGDASFSPTLPSRDPTDATYVAASAIPVYRAVVVSATTSPTVLAGWRSSALAAVGATGWTKLVTSQFTDLLVGNGDAMRSFHPDQWETSGIGFEAVTGAAHGDPSIRLIPTGYNELGSQMGIDAPVGGSAGVARTGFGLAASNPATADLGPYLTANSSYQNWNTMFQNRELAQTLALDNISMTLGVQGVSTALGAITGAAQGALGGGAVGGPAGAVVGAATGVAGAASHLITASMEASNSITLLAINTDGSFDIGAYGLSVTGEAAIASFNTWAQSLTSNPGSGNAHRLASAWRAIIAQAFEVVIAMPSAERVKTLISMWTRYGYMIGQAFVPPQLNAMSAYTYWETTDALVTGGVPQQHRQTIAAAFNAGVTVWDDVALIGTKPTNTPLAGISY